MHQIPGSPTNTVPLQLPLDQTEPAPHHEPTQDRLALPRANINTPPPHDNNSPNPNQNIAIPNHPIPNPLANPNPVGHAVAAEFFANLLNNLNPPSRSPSPINSPIRSPSPINSPIRSPSPER